MEVKPINENYSAYVLHEDEQRPCGKCTACCTALSVIELRKSDYTHCQHECAQGCAIYHQRPSTCRTFACLWKVPNWILHDDDRPDKLGVIFCVRNVEERKQFEVWEIWPGAAQQPRVQALLQQIQVPHILISPLVWSVTV
jgi:hypothetical protein